MSGIPVWKKAPFLRLLVPLMIGIIIQVYYRFPLNLIILSLVCFSVAVIALRFLPAVLVFKLQAFRGLLINLIIVTFACLLTFKKDIRNEIDWIGNVYADSAQIIATISEPLQIKPKSYKANAAADAVTGSTASAVKGNLILYFEKDSAAQKLNYGDRIIINQRLQPIKNSGNPGGFNYEQFAGMKQIFHTVYLKKEDWVLLKEKNINPFQQWIFDIQQHIVNTLQKFIKGDNEKAVAEALLIGYKEDLDRDLVQAYSNTGVVHIIAISGLHLSAIYILLIAVFKRIPAIKKSKILQLTGVLICLWIFAILTGASASVLRSAVMFSFLLAGQMSNKKISVYNTLSASAFALLCYNPYLLWEVGFQLSYLSVLSIVIFQRSFYNIIRFSNKILNFLWELISVSFAAQILTFPLAIYLFHQFPLLFFVTNIFAVPASTIILYGEICLLSVSYFDPLAMLVGKITSFILWLMNSGIIAISNISFSVWDGIPATIFTTLLLYICIAAFSAGILQKNKTVFKAGLYTLLIFCIVIAIEKWISAKQQKIIVYNIPQHAAVDIIRGNSFQFIGDSTIMATQNSVLKQGRIFFSADRASDTLLKKEMGRFFIFNNKRIVWIDSAIVFTPATKKIDADLIIISKNPKVFIKEISDVFNCKKYVFDASNSAWKISRWKQDCQTLNLPYYTVAEKGALVIDVNTD